MVLKKSCVRHIYMASCFNPVSVSENVKAFINLYIKKTLKAKNAVRISNLGINENTFKK